MRHLKKGAYGLSQSGFVKLKNLPFIMMIGCFWAGGQGLYTAFTNRNPTVLSYEEYVRTKPSATWLVITNCQLDLARACYLSYLGDKNPNQYEYYVPVRSRSFPTDKIYILLKTADPGLKATIAEMNSAKSPQGWALKNLKRVFPRQDVRGLVSCGIDLRSHDHDELAKVEKVDKDFIVIDSDAQPSFAAGIAYTVGGFAVLAALVLYSNRKTEAALCSS